ncbi:hypothetical protein BV25DRAFT_947726 [Artomyces pyxidatus]|uniref:Uncharacterized protein n=1 Tax=Artomyces pyxidatus TaxID=48021 RepID=A0ACB8SY33_9AGAM|nr:hypothetical protein BV25DRAFT_947726 [Artomyces pyxidatus]
MEQAALPIIVVTPPLPSRDELPEMMRLALESILTGMPMAPSAADTVAGDASSADEHASPTDTSDSYMTARSGTSSTSSYVTAPENVATPENVAIARQHEAEPPAVPAKDGLALVRRRPGMVHRSGSRRHGRVFSAEGELLPTATGGTLSMSGVALLGINATPRASHESGWGSFSRGMGFKLLASTLLGFRR